MAEKAKRVEIVTPQSLLKDNQSALAQSGIARWQTAKQAGLLTITDSCSDARVSMTAALGGLPVVSLRSIASAHFKPDGDPYEWVYGHGSASRAVVFEHFDGETVEPGRAPKGCGGLGEKAKITEKKAHAGSITNAFEYVRERIAHEDLVLQAIVSAARVASHSRIPVLAALIDHRDYKMYPIAKFTGKSLSPGSFISHVNLGDILDYNPERLYRNGIPYMDLSGVPGPFLDIVEANQKQHELLMQNPDFYEDQKVQNPHTVIISTDIRPAGIRYPKHYGKPNTSFIVRLPYSKDGGLHIKPEDLSEAVAQAGYALSHATSAQKGQAFASTSNLLIETPNMGLTREITQAVLANPTVKAWQTEKKGQVIGAEVISANVTKIDNL